MEKIHDFGAWWIITHFDDDVMYNDTAIFVSLLNAPPGFWTSSYDWKPIPDLVAYYYLTHYRKVNESRGAAYNLWHLGGMKKP